MEVAAAAMKLVFRMQGGERKESIFRQCRPGRRSGHRWRAAPWVILAGGRVA